MNEKGKLNLGLIFVGIIAITIISFGAFSVVSRAQDAIPKAPILQADPDTPVDSPPDEQPANEEPVEESVDDSDEQSTDEQAEVEEPADEETVEGDITPPSDVNEIDESDKSHRDRTPRELSSLGIYFLDDEGSQVAERTNKINAVDLPSAMGRKNDQARSYQTANSEGRFDPLYITDFIPDGLRPELEGEGISGAIDSGLIDQLIQTQISTYFKYLPIQIIGTMQNGPYKSALISIQTMGYYKILKQGQGDTISAFGSEEGYYVVSMTVTQISEDHVTISMSATLYDYVYQRVISSTPAVTRHFYVRRYN